MSCVQPKLHVVLTARANHAEFKCHLCRKLFISSYHLNSHNRRRHRTQEDSSKYKDLAGICRGTLNEKMLSSNGVDASRRMEKLLRNLNVEEMKAFSNNYRWSSTPNSKAIHADYFGDDDLIISPLAYSLNDLEENPEQNTHLNKFLKPRSYEEINRIHSSNVSNTIKPNGKKRDLDLSNEKENLGKISFAERVYRVKTVPHCENSEKHCVNNKQDFIGLQEISCNSKQAAPQVKTVSCSTMTETFLLDTFVKVNQEDTNSNVDVFTQTEPNMMQTNLSTVNYRSTKSPCDDNAEPVIMVQNRNEIISDSSKQDDCSFISDNNNTQVKNSFEGSFEVKKSLLTTKDNSVHSFSDSSSGRKFKNTIKVKRINEEMIKELPEQDNIDIEVCNGNELVANTSAEYSQHSLQNQDCNGSIEHSYDHCYMQVEITLAKKLRKIGIDPDWTGITDKMFEKTNSLLKIKRRNISKKKADYEAMRSMLNNTIDQILESKETT